MLTDIGNRQQLEVWAYDTDIVALDLVHVAVAVIPGRGGLDGSFPVEVEVLDMSTVLGNDTKEPVFVPSGSLGSVGVEGLEDPWSGVE